MEPIEEMEEFKIPKEALEKLRDPELLRRKINEGKVLQEIIGYTHETMEKFYQIAYKLFQHQQYQEAGDAFIFLTTLNPYVYNYWLGLGMSEQLSNKYDGALIAYATAILIKVENPLPHYHSASCYLALKDWVNAIASLDLAILYAGDHPEYAAIKKYALGAKEALRNKGS